MERTTELIGKPPALIDWLAFLVVFAFIARVIFSIILAEASPLLEFHKPFEQAFKDIEPCMHKDEIRAIAKKYGFEFHENINPFQTPHLETRAEGIDILGENVRPRVFLSVELNKHTERATRISYSFWYELVQQKPGSRKPVDDRVKNWYTKHRTPCQPPE